jgi:ABC-2 type transport system ATP-binding protein
MLTDPTPEDGVAPVSVEARGLVRRFGAVTALDGLSFEIARG